MKEIHRYVVIPVSETDNRAWSYPFISQAFKKEQELIEEFGEGNYVVVSVKY